jgi:hypothetical protein
MDQSLGLLPYYNLGDICGFNLCLNRMQFWPKEDYLNRRINKVTRGIRKITINIMATNFENLLLG